MSTRLNPHHFCVALKAAAAAALATMPALSFAAFTLPMISGFGCEIVNWMKGELAIIIFLVVAVSTIIIGMFAKMDWTKILSIVILFGILQGLAAAGASYFQFPSCFN